jgi:hypothetical protein
MTMTRNEHFLERRVEFALLTRQGWSMSKIAEKYNISRQAVSLSLKKAVIEGEVVYKCKACKNDTTNYIIIRRKKPSACCECGKEFFVANKKTKTCSPECLKKLREKTLYGGEWSRAEFIELDCKGCGQSFKRSKYIFSVTSKCKKNKDHNYCSRKCYHHSKRWPNKLPELILYGKD